MYNSGSRYLLFLHTSHMYMDIFREAVNGILLHSHSLVGILYFIQFFFLLWKREIRIVEFQNYYYVGILNVKCDC